jgi:hypothetical protein
VSNEEDPGVSSEGFSEATMLRGDKATSDICDILVKSISPNS